MKASEWVLTKRSSAFEGNFLQSEPKRLQPCVKSLNFESVQRMQRKRKVAKFAFLAFQMEVQSFQTLQLCTVRLFL